VAARVLAWSPGNLRTQDRNIWNRESFAYDPITGLGLRGYLREGRAEDAAEGPVNAREMDPETPRPARRPSAGAARAMGERNDARTEFQRALNSTRPQRKRVGLHLPPTGPGMNCARPGQRSLIADANQTRGESCVRWILVLDYEGCGRISISAAG